MSYTETSTLEAVRKAEELGRTHGATDRAAGVVEADINMSAQLETHISEALFDLIDMNDWNDQGVFVVEHELTPAYDRGYFAALNGAA